MSITDTNSTKPRKSQRPLSVWELPKLLKSVHQCRKSVPKNVASDRTIERFWRSSIGTVLPLRVRFSDVFQSI